MFGVVPIKKEIVLLGGGHAHVAVLKQFGMRPLPGVRLTLISPGYDTPYSGMLPGHIAGHYTFAESHIALLSLCQFAGAQFYRDAAIGLDLGKRKVHCQQHPPVAFDILSIDTGSTPAIHPTPGAADYAIPIKPIDRFLHQWAVIESKLKNKTNHPTRIVIVGAGAGGVELTLSLQHRLEQRRRKPGTPEAPCRFSLITASPTILPNHNPRVQKSYRKILAARKVDVHLNRRITEVRPNQILAGQNEKYEYDYLLWATEASAPAWLQAAGLAVNAQGFLAVNNYLQSTSHPFVFAAGDVASMALHPRPKSGVFAVRQGPPLARNLRATALSELNKSRNASNAKRAIPLVSYTPQKRFLSLISTGDAFAVASRGCWSVKGKWVWKWKNWIDRRWMRRYQNLPAMNPPPPDRGKSEQNAPLAPEMRCAGCGSKVGSRILTRTLQRIETAQSRSIDIGLDAPDDAAVFSLPPESRLVQTVDFLPAFLDDPFLAGQITALHCLSDILAMGAQPRNVQIIAVVSYGNELSTEESLFQLLSGAVKTLNAHQTDLIGGHTLEGQQFALGMTVNGLLHDSTPWRKQGLKPGDQLILTKPLGTGMILAALMQQKSQSCWIVEAIRQMLHSNAAAIPILRRHEITAATDCTGFGLIGHLAEMMEASAVDAVLKISEIPLLAGAIECARNRIFSSLYPQNRQRCALIANNTDFQSAPRYPVLFDPQTSGGLLFGLPAAKAQTCLQQLQQTGYKHAAIIGTILPKTARHPQLTLHS